MQQLNRKQNTWILILVFYTNSYFCGKTKKSMKSKTKLKVLVISHSISIGNKNMMMTGENHVANYFLSIVIAF
jgi:thioredoxin-related protein